MTERQIFNYSNRHFHIMPVHCIRIHTFVDKHKIYYTRCLCAYDENDFLLCGWLAGCLLLFYIKSLVGWFLNKSTESSKY